MPCWPAQAGDTHSKNAVVENNISRSMRCPSSPVEGCYSDVGAKRHARTVAWFRRDRAMRLPRLRAVPAHPEIGARCYFRTTAPVAGRYVDSCHDAPLEKKWCWFGVEP